MRYHHLLETIIPPTTYGYWITDDGKIIVVAQDGDHYPVVIQHFGEDAIGNEYETAMRAGWIRIAGLEDTDGLAPDFCADTFGKMTSKRAISVMFRIAKEREYHRYFHCDDNQGIERFHHTLADFMKSVRQATG